MARELHLNQILGLLKREFGFDSWIANGFIRDVQAMDDKICPTFCITKDGVLGYSPEWMDKWANTPNKLIEVLTHEMLHKVFGDFTRSPDELENIAGDIIINFTVYKLLGHCDLATSFYPKKMWQGLLRPGCHTAANNTKYENLYNFVYDRKYGQTGDQDKQSDSIAQVYHALKVLMPKNKGKYVLLGGHPGEEEGEVAESLALDQDDKAKIAEELVEKLMKKNAGQGDNLTGLVIKAIKAECGLRRELLADFAINAKINKLKKYYDTRRATRSPVPQNPSRRDLAMLASGNWPVLWRNEIHSRNSKNQGMVWYVDVSGSQWGDLPEILGIMSNFKSMISKVYQFSNDIFESSLQEMVNGKIESTGGTDFNCVIDHAVTNNFKKIIIVTDGYADASSESMGKAKSCIEKACVILTKNGCNPDNFFSKHYQRTHYMSEIIK